MLQEIWAHCQSQNVWIHVCDLVPEHIAWWKYDLTIIVNKLNLGDVRMNFLTHFHLLMYLFITILL